MLSEIDWEDWQMTKSIKPYEMIKYEMQLIVHTLDRDQDQEQGKRITRRTSTQMSTQTPIRHFLSEPGITATNIFSAHLDFMSEISMYLAFLLVSINL